MKGKIKGKKRKIIEVVYLYENCTDNYFLRLNQSKTLIYIFVSETGGKEYHHFRIEMKL